MGEIENLMEKIDRDVRVAMGLPESVVGKE